MRTIQKIQYIMVAMLLLTDLQIVIVSALSDKRLCANLECNKIVAMGSARMNYNAAAPGMISFKIKSPIRIYSKEAGNDTSLWGIEVYGRRGYAPKGHIKEETVYVGRQKLIEVPTSEELVREKEENTTLKPSEPNIEDSKPTTPLEVVPPVVESVTKSPEENISNVTPVQVIDGTSILYNENVEPTTTTTTTKGVENGSESTENHRKEEEEEKVTNSKKEAEIKVDAGSEKIENIKNNETNFSKDIETEDELKKEEEMPVVNEKVEEIKKVSENQEELKIELEKPAVEDMKIELSKKLENEEELKKEEEKPAVEVTKIELSKKLETKDEFKKEEEKPAVEDLKIVLSKELENEEELKKEVENPAVEELKIDLSKESVNEEELQKGREEKPAVIEKIEDPKNELETENDSKKEQEKLEIIEGVEEKATTIPYLLDAFVEADHTTTSIPLNIEIKENVSDTEQQKEAEIVKLDEQKNEKLENEIEKILMPEEITVINNETITVEKVNESLETLEPVVPTNDTENDSGEKSSIELATPIESVIARKVGVMDTENQQSVAAGSEINNELNLNFEPTISPVPSTEVPNMIPDPNMFYKHLQEQAAKPEEEIMLNENSNEIPQVETQSENPETSYEYSNEIQQELIQPEKQESIFENHEVEAPFENAVEFQETSTEAQVVETPLLASVENAEPQKEDAAHSAVIAEKVEHEGLFGTILGTVNSFWSTEKKEVPTEEDDELQRILYSNSNTNKDDSTQYCMKEVACECKNDLKDFTMDNFVERAADKFLELSDLLAYLGIASLSTIIFLFGYYCFCNSSREGPLIAKLNHIERSLLVAQKENAILKNELEDTRQKLSGIENNSFGSNDMVISLRQQLDEVNEEKERLQQQVHTLEKELENAAEAGLELNKIVSDLLSNQTGDESIISSVEELQKQLNEQQNTILEINANLAEKSRENSELQLMLAEQGARLNGEIASLQQDNDELETEKSNLQTRLDEMKNEFDEDITKALEGKNFEIKRLQNDIMELQRKCEMEHTKWQTSLAKVEALEECLKTLKKDPSVKISEVMNVANVRAEILDMQKKCAGLKERLDVELENKRLFEDKMKSCVEEVEKLKADFHQSEKDKLEAQTRLEVLSNYFKEKETQLQKELSVKEAMWLKQQGETTSTVDRLTSMQEEINSLKSQNDALRAEIEAQLAAHKAQTGTLEHRAHETWLAVRQAERRYEEARAEASALRRKLTAIVGGNQTDAQRATTDGKAATDAPSPVNMESPGSPLLGRMPMPMFLPPPHFMGLPPPFMGMPPPPFLPAGEMRPPPLGRMMSPPPRMGYSSGKFNNSYDDKYDDDDDYDSNDDEENEHEHAPNRRYSRDSDDWSRHGKYSPRTYRSQSPADSRYNYTDREPVSTYDTETDFSPPPSPRDRRTRSSRAGSFKAYSPPPPTASSPLTENSNGKRPSTSSVNKAFAAINLSRIEPYYNHSSSESNNNRRFKRGGGTGTDSERSSNKAHNGRLV